MASPLRAGLDGPSRTIIVEPLEAPLPRPLPERAPEEPARGPEPGPRPERAPRPEHAPEKVPAGCDAYASGLNTSPVGTFG